MTQGKHEIRVPGGTIAYRESGDPSGPAVVFVHGLLVNGTLWDGVAERIAPWARCIQPDLPLGAHAIGLDDDAERTPHGIARMIADFLEALDLRDAVLVANDTGGALAQLVVTTRPERVGRLVLTPCDAFDNFLPPMFRPMQAVAKIPGALTLALQPARLRAIRNTPLAFGMLTKRPIPHALSDGWVHAFLANRDVRRDVARFLAAIDTDVTIEAATRLHTFTRPALVVWTEGDRVFPADHGRRLATLLPDARLEIVDDSRAFVPLDRPDRLAELLTDFARDTAAREA